MSSAYEKCPSVSGFGHRACCAAVIIVCVLTVLCIALWLSKMNRDFGFVGAAGGGDIGKVRRYLDSGVPPDGPHMEGITACEYAAFYGKTAVVKLLLERGADPNRGIYQAITSERPELVKLFIEHGAITRKAGPEHESSPYAVAKSRGNVAVIRVIEAAQR